MNQSVRVGDSAIVLKEIASESVDLIVTDPPYGYSFMGKDWDRAVPSVDIWRECLRVLKPGAFAFIMSAPRLDVQSEMARRVQEAGFDIAFTPLFWAYATGFPKAMNVSKAVDKRLGAEREVIGKNPNDRTHRDNNLAGYGLQGGVGMGNITAPATPQAKALDGAYAGFQPKPAVEVIMVAMKPLSEKTYVDQALANGKGVTWLDDGRIPTCEPLTGSGSGFGANTNDYGGNSPSYISTSHVHESGRFPANLLVSDDVLSQDFSRYFSLDKWAEKLPFLIVPKASKGEKNKGLENIERRGGSSADGSECSGVQSYNGRNFHPTVKPLKLMSYLITLGSRPGDLVLDPFAGSGTTLVAAKELGRDAIGIELSEEYAAIINARLGSASRPLEAYTTEG